MLWSPEFASVAKQSHRYGLCPMRLLRYARSFVFILSLSGCGYTLSHRLKDTFNDKRGVFVPVFENTTEEVGVERVFTNALIRELQSRGEVVMSSRSKGGLELLGKLDVINVAPTAWSDVGFKGLPGFRRAPSELGVDIGMSLVLIDPEKGEIWRRRFSGRRRVEAPLDRTYNFQAPSAVGPITQSIVESKYADIARDIMRDVYDEMVELF